MTNKHRIIIVAVIVVIMVAVFFIMLRPSIHNISSISSKIQQQKEENAQLLSRIAQLSRVKEDFSMLYARYQKYSVQLPSSSNIQVLTNDIYNIAQFADVDLQSISFGETITEDDKIGIIEINMVLSGPYYNILVFIRTFESMPRINRLDSIDISYSAEGYPVMTATIIGETFYQKAE
jgi:Tfp pilus assembly protein PilO